MAGPRDPNWTYTTSVDLPDRTFQMWAFNPSHSLLLLRSAKDLTGGPLGGSFPTRVDLEFRGVAAIHLPTLLPGLTMVVAEGEDDRRVRQGCGTRLSARRKVFLVHGLDYDGFVVALVAVITTDDRDFFEPSALWPD